MNSATALARVLVDELVRCGVTEAVLAPGSRSAPLALALHAADAAGRLRLHVRIDERTAGFLALGLAKAGGAPVPVVCTSGTAVANLLPAAVEASAAGIPLLLLTADRPPELRGSGANQTIDQVKIFGSAVRAFVELGVPEDRPGQVAAWRASVGRGVAAATGWGSGDPGPAHLNVPMREPLLPDGDEAWVESLDGRPDGRPWTAVSAVPVPSALAPSGSAGTTVSGGSATVARTLVVVGDCRPATGRAAVRLAADRGWPLVAEPLTPARSFALACGTLLLDDAKWLDAHRPDRVLVVGRPTLARAVTRLLRDPVVAVDVVTDGPRWADPHAVARSVAVATGGLDPSRGGAAAEGAASGPAVRGDPAYLAAWEAADARVGAAVADVLAGEPEPTGLHVARTLVAHLAGPRPLLVLGSSSVVRDVDLVGGRPAADVELLANRGAAGIDGLVSTAVGAALAHQRAGGGQAYALLGDLTLLHDTTGLVLGPDEPRPDLTLVVVNDDGGGIFGLLEPGAPAHAGSFERIFGTPHGVALAALCAATGVRHVAVSNSGALAAVLAPAAGLTLVEVQVDRRSARSRAERLSAAVARALASR